MLTIDDAPGVVAGAAVVSRLPWLLVALFSGACVDGAMSGWVRAVVHRRAV